MKEALKVYKIDRKGYLTHRMCQMVDMFRTMSVSRQDLLVSMSVILSGVEMMYSITPQLKEPNLDKIIDLSHALSKKITQ